VEVLGVEENKITVAVEAAGDVFFPRPIEQSQDVLRKLGIRRPYFLFAGAVSGRKNLVRLIEAWRNVENRVNGASLVIVGRDGLRFADGKGIGALPSSVRQVPPARDEDLAGLYSAAQGLLYPSLYEGFGLPILEAMACGCPVLTSNRTAMPEVAGNAAVLVDPLDANSIGEGIIALTDECVASDLRAKGFKRCREFSWSRTAQIVESAILN
jgi:glycosyltransferase involved in cell wall biosynthesis